MFFFLSYSIESCVGTRYVGRSERRGLGRALERRHAVSTRCNIKRKSKETRDISKGRSVFLPSILFDKLNIAVKKRDNASKTEGKREYGGGWEGKDGIAQTRRVWSEKSENPRGKSREATRENVIVFDYRSVRRLVLRVSGWDNL